MAFENPFILYNNLLEDYFDSISTESTIAPKENLWDWKDWTYWVANDTNDQWVIIDRGASGQPAVNCIAVSGHNWGTADGNGVLVTVEQDDNSGFTSPTSLGTITVLVDEPFYLEFTDATERYIRISMDFISPTAPAGLWASRFFIGEKLELPVGPEFSFDPDVQEAKTMKFRNYNGDIITTSKRYSSREMNVEFKRIPQSFVASDLLPFLEDHYGEMLPFFFVPDPANVFSPDPTASQTGSKIYCLIAPDEPTISLPVYNDDINFRNWTMIAIGTRQNKYRG